VTRPDSPAKACRLTKVSGDEVFAGTITERRPPRSAVTAPASQRHAVRSHQAVEEAQGLPCSDQRSWIASRRGDTPAVFVFALALLPCWDASFARIPPPRRSTSPVLLVIACPLCAG